MDDTPMQGDDWNQIGETLVVPLSLTQFWDAFWADEAVYYSQSVVRDIDDKINLSTVWGPPTAGKEKEFDAPVIEERNMNKKIRNRVAFAPDYADLEMRFSLLEKTDTVIKIKETHVTKNAPYVDDFEIWLIWNILTPDKNSRQTVFRR